MATNGVFSVSLVSLTPLSWRVNSVSFSQSGSKEKKRNTEQSEIDHTAVDVFLHALVTLAEIDNVLSKVGYYVHVRFCNA